jgi:hypothetical protein
MTAAARPLGSLALLALRCRKAAREDRSPVLSSEEAGLVHDAIEALFGLQAAAGELADAVEGYLSSAAGERNAVQVRTPKRSPERQAQWDSFIEEILPEPPESTESVTAPRRPRAPTPTKTRKQLDVERSERALERARTQGIRLLKPHEPHEPHDGGARG